MAVPNGLDLIELRGLRGRGFHGVLDHERAHGQEFVVDAVVGAELGEAGRADDLSLTIDYSELAEDLHRLIAGEPVRLIETLALRMVDLCLAYPGVRWASVTVHKPEAPIAVAFDDVAVTIERSRT